LISNGPCGSNHTVGTGHSGQKFRFPRADLIQW
jgi:hypothetical protein